jgi:hypothetical protein
MLLRVCLIGVGIVSLGCTTHSLLSWMDRRGWILYRSSTKKPLTTRIGNALMEWEQFYNPAIEHVIEYRRHGDLWVQETGEPFEPPGGWSITEPSGR